MDTTNPTPPADAILHDITQAAAQLAAANTPADWRTAEAVARWIAAAAAEQAREHVAPAATAPVLAAAGIDPRARHVAFSRIECRTCGDMSAWFDQAGPQVPAATWDVTHAEETGHTRTYLWSVTRQTAELFGGRRPRKGH